MSLGANKQALMGAAGAAGGGTNFYSYQIANSIRGSAADDRTLKFTAGTPTSADTFTMSYWVKRQTTSTDDAANVTFVAGTGGGTYFYISLGLDLFLEGGGGNWGSSYLQTNAAYRDTSAWYHHILVFDSTQGSANNRLKVYVNGVQQTSFAQDSLHGNIGSSEDFSFINASGVVQSFGGISGVGHGTEGADLSLADVMFFDGQAYYSELGETKNGVWIPKDPSGLTFGNNGYWLKFESSSDLGNDSSGNNNDFTVANFAAHDQLLDSPTFNSSSNGGNFATIGPLWKTSDMTFSEGNLKWTCSTNERGLMSNWAVPIGTKAYWEYKPVSWGGNTSNGDEMWIGINQGIAALVGGDRGGKTTGYAYGTSNGYKTILASASSYGATIRSGDIVGVAVDRVNHTINFSKNGSWQGTFAISSTMDLFPFIGSGGGTSSASGIFNFGADGTFSGTVTAQGNSDDTGYGNFYYDPPTGFLAMCSGNLPIVAEVDPAQTDDDYPQKLFGTLQYTGNNSERTIDTTFQIDKSWARSTVQGQDWYVLDTSRGYFGASSNNYYIKLNAEGGQASLPQYNFKAQSGSDITITGGTWFNSGGHTQQMWNWRLAGGTTAANTQGDVNSTVQVDPSGCFSIVTYQAGLSSSGAVTVGHGLSKAPTFLIQTAYGSGVTGQRWVRSSGLTSWNYGIQITSNGAQQDKSGNGDMSADPTSSVFSVNYTEGLGDGSADNVTYAFADCDGYIKSGKFIGNADADGTFIYLGFKPAFFWILHAASGDDPQVWDTSNGSYNPMTKTLSTHNNSAQVDNANRSVDFLSNGVKIRSSNSNVNSSNAAGIIYLAMAKNPFKYATAR